VQKGHSSAEQKMSFTPREPTKFTFSQPQRTWGVASQQSALCTVPAVFNAQECAALIKEADKVGASKGWHHRGASLPTDDVLVSDLSDSSRALIKKRVDRLLHVGAAEGLIRSKQLPAVSETFVIKYGAPADCKLSRRTGATANTGSIEERNCRDALRKHVDSTALTINISLSNESEYEGGGTRFFAADRKELTIRNAAGSALLHDGDIEHAGVAISSGKRYILVAFCKIGGASRSSQPVPSNQTLPKMRLLEFPACSRFATSRSAHAAAKKLQEAVSPPASGLARLLSACSLSCMSVSMDTGRSLNSQE